MTQDHEGLPISPAQAPGWNIAVLGLNHRTAPVALREQLYFEPEQLPVAFKALRGELGLSECAVLSTCNRVELYALLPQPNGAQARLKNFLARFHRVNVQGLNEALYWHLQPDSVRHLFRVAAGLDSMVLGESEILGQVKSAYADAVTHSSVGPVFHTLFQAAIRAGKQVRAQTRIGQGATSVSSVAVELARQIFQDLSTKTILILGAGEMVEATLHALRGQGTGSILVANRSEKRALPLAESVGGHVVALDALDATLPRADIVICSTSARTFLLEKEQVCRASAARGNQPLFLIDISVPRNLDPAIRQLENVHLYDIDDLDDIASSNRKMRLGEMDRCAEIIERETDCFLSRFQLRERVPLLA